MSCKPDQHDDLSTAWNVKFYFERWNYYVMMSSLGHMWPRLHHYHSNNRCTELIPDLNQEFRGISVLNQRLEVWTKLFTIIIFLIRILNEYWIQCACTFLFLAIFRSFRRFKIEINFIRFQNDKDDAIIHQFTMNNEIFSLSFGFYPLLLFLHSFSPLFVSDSVLGCIWNRPNRLFRKFVMLFVVSYELLWGCSMFICFFFFFFFRFSKPKWSLNQTEHWTAFIALNIVLKH